MNVTKIDRRTCEMLSKEMTAAMETVAAKYGLKLDSKGGSFTSATFAKKFEFKVISEDGVDVAAEKNFVAFASMYGLQPDWFGKTFVGNSRDEMKIIGLNTRRPKNPVLLENLTTGAKHKCAASYVTHYFK
jgi:hypothetical protein